MDGKFQYTKKTATLGHEGGSGAGRGGVGRGGRGDEQMVIETQGRDTSSRKYKGSDTVGVGISLLLPPIVCLLQ